MTEFSLISAMHLPELDDRMLRLEGKVDDLKDLMMRILRQLESPKSS
jgi:hypothetical protein